MGKNNRKKKKQKHTLVPDEVYQNGSLRITRFGKNLLFENNRSHEEHSALLDNLKVAHKKTFSGLKEKIASLQGILGEYHPALLMYRASYQVFGLFLKYTSESDFTSEENVNLPGVEYLQYLISRTPHSGIDKDLPEDEWEEIWKLTREIIELTKHWIFTRPTLKNPPDAIDELRFFLDNKRLLMRVNRYGYFLEDYWKDTFLPYNTWIKELYKVEAVDLVNGLKLIAEHQKTGLVNRYRDMVDTGNKLRDLLEQQGYGTGPDDSVEERERTRDALHTEFQAEYEEMESKLQQTMTPDLFDITDITTLPAEILDVLSVSPGESIQTDLESNDDISPLSNSLLHSKPLLKYNGRYYHFFHTGLEDRIAEIIEIDLLKRLPHAASSMLEIRGLQLEETAISQLKKILTPENAFLNVFYPNPDDVGNLTELDGLLLVDDVMFLMECKAGKFSESASRGAPKSLLSDLSDLIVEGQRQSERAERYIKSAPIIDFFDETGKKIVCQIDHSKFRKIFRVIVTREPLGWVGAKIARLAVLDKNILNNPPWHISIDDLKTVADIFENRGAQFCQYLELRLLAAENDKLDQADEIDQIGVYLDRNFYHETGFSFAERFSYTHFGKVIDDYFAKKLIGEEVTPLQQYLPLSLETLINAISNSQFPGRFEVIKFLFSLSKEGRDDLENYVCTLLDRYRQGRHSSIRLPISGLRQGLSITFAKDSNYNVERVRSGVMLSTSGLDAWFIIKMSSPFVVSSIEKLLPDSIPESELQQEQGYVEDKMFSTATSKYGKIGRNDPCPCGSGKKHKQCHGKN